MTVMVAGTPIAALRAEAFESPLKKITRAFEEKIEKIEKSLGDKKSKKEKKGEKKKQSDKKDTKSKNKDNEKNRYNFSKNKKYPPRVVDAKEIERCAEFASQKTGVRKQFIMGMLAVESNLGRNPGECTYEQVSEDAKKSYQKGLLSEAAWNTFNQRREVIESIADELGYDHKTLLVSCNPSNYAGTGGAMGIPQFMPDTWLEYKERVGSLVSKNNPDPWDPLDGVVAMALKVSDVPGVKEHNLWSERNAAKLYLSGTTSWHYDWYADQILYWSRNYEKLMG